MDAKTLLEHAKKLDRDERIDLVQAIWDSVADEPNDDGDGLTDAQRTELLRRAEAARADPDGGSTWEEVTERIRARWRTT